MRVWRISNHQDLSGIGGKYSDGRWNNLGTKIVYCSDHPSTCMLELLVRFDPDLTPNTFKLLEIELSKDSVFEDVKLPKGWEKKPEVTRKIWERFCKINTAPVLKVPSIVMPQASHYLLNPHHSDHGKHEVAQIYDNFLDERFYV